MDSNLNLINSIKVRGAGEFNVPIPIFESKLIELLNGVSLNRRKHTDMLINTATSGGVALKFSERQLHQIRNNDYTFDIETIPSVVGRDGYRTNDIIWQFTAGHSVDGSITNTYSGISDSDADFFLRKFNKGAFKYETATRQEQVAFDTFARIGKNKDIIGAGKNVTAMQVLGNGDDKYTLAIEGIHHLRKMGTTGTTAIAEDLEKYVNANTTLVTYNGLAFDRGVLSATINNSDSFSMARKQRLTDLLYDINHYDPYTTLKEAYRINPSSMNQAYKDLIMNANIDSNKKKLGGKYYLAGQGQYRQETFGRMLGIDVSQAHDASADIEALKQINNKKEFQQLINHANEIIGGSRLGYENISEGTKLFNTSSLWGNQNIFMIEKDGNQYNVPKIFTRFDEKGKHYRSYSGSPIVAGSSYEVEKIINLTRRDKFGRFVYEHAHDLQIRGVHNLQAMVLRQANGEGPQKIIIGDADNLSSMIMDHFSVLGYESGDQFIPHQEGINKALRHTGVKALNTVEDQLAQIEEYSNQRLMASNVYDKLDTATFKREGIIVNNLMKYFPNLEKRKQATSLLKDMMEYGHSAAKAASAYKIGQSGGIFGDKELKVLDNIVAKARYGMQDNYLGSFDAIRQEIEAINPNDFNTIISEVSKATGFTDLNQMTPEAEKQFSYVLQQTFGKYKEIASDYTDTYGTRFAVTPSMMGTLLGSKNYKNNRVFSIDTNPDNKQIAIDTIDKAIRNSIQSGNKPVLQSDLRQVYVTLAKGLEKYNPAFSEFGLSRKMQVILNSSTATTKEMSGLLLESVNAYKQVNPKDLSFKTYGIVPGKELLGSDLNVNVIRSAAKSAADATVISKTEQAEKLFRYMLGGVTEEDFIHSLGIKMAGESTYSMAVESLRLAAYSTVHALGKDNNLIINRDGVLVGNGNVTHNIGKFIPKLEVNGNGQVINQIGGMSYGIGTSVSINANGVKQISVQSLEEFNKLPMLIGKAFKDDPNKNPGEMLYDSYRTISKRMKETYYLDPTTGQLSKKDISGINAVGLNKNHPAHAQYNASVNLSDIQSNLMKWYDNGYIKDADLKKYFKYNSYEELQEIANELKSGHIKPQHAAALRNFIADNSSMLMSDISTTGITLDSYDEKIGLKYSENVLVDGNNKFAINTSTPMKLNSKRLAFALEGYNVDNTMIATNATATPDLARSYQQSLQQSAKLNIAQAEETAKLYGSSLDRYNNSSNPVNYKYVNKDYTLNANNLTISYHDDKDFNFINKLSNKYAELLEKEYKTNLTDGAASDLPVILKRRLSGLVEGSAVTTAEFHDITKSSLQSRGNYNVNLGSTKVINDIKGQRIMPFEYDKETGKLMFRDPESLIVKRGDILYENDLNSEFGSTIKRAKTDMYGKVYLIDSKGNILDKSQTTKILESLGPNNRPEEVSKIIDSLRMGVAKEDIDLGTHTIKKGQRLGIETHLVYKAIEDNSVKIFKGTDKHQTVSTALRFGEADKRLKSLAQKYGFNKLTEKHISLEFMLNFMNGRTKEVEYFHDASKGNSNKAFTKFKKELTNIYGSMENATNAVLNERNFVSKVFEQSIGKKIDTISGVSETVKRKSVIDALNKIFTQVMDGKSEDEKESLYKSLAKHLNDNQTFELANGTEIVLDEKTKSLVISDKILGIRSTSDSERTLEDVVKELDDQVFAGEIKRKFGDIKKAVTYKTGDIDQFHVNIFGNDYLDQVFTPSFNASEVKGNLGKQSLHVDDFKKLSEMFPQIFAKDYEDTVKSGSEYYRYGDKILDNAKQVKYLTTEKKESQLIASANDFTKGSIEEAIYKEYNAKGQHVTKEFIRAEASRLSQLAALESEGQFNARRDNSREAYKIAKREINKTHTFEEFLDNLGPGDNYIPGKISATVDTGTGEKKNISLVIPRHDYSPKTKQLVGSITRDIEEISQYTIADTASDNKERINTLLNRVAENKQELYNTMKATAVKKSDLTKGVLSSYTLGPKALAASATNLFDFESSFDNKEMFLGKTIKEVREAGGATLFATAGISHFEKLGILRDDMSQEERMKTIERLKQKGETIGFARYPLDYPESINYGKIYLDDSLEDGVIQSNRQLAKLMKLDYDGDKLNTIRLNEGLIDASDKTNQKLLAVHSAKLGRSYSHDIVLANEYGDTNKTLDDFVIKKESDGNTMIRQIMSGFAGETYNINKNLSVFATDIGLNESVNLAPSIKMDMRHFITMSTTAINEARLSSKNNSTEALSKNIEFGQFFNQLFDEAKSNDDFREIGQKIVDAGYTKDAAESFYKLHGNETQILNDIAVNESVVDKSARAQEYFDNAFVTSFHRMADQAEAKGYKFSGGAFKSLLLNEMPTFATQDQEKTRNEVARAVDANNEMVAMQEKANSPAQQVMEKTVDDISHTEQLMNKGMAERTAKLRSNAFSSLNKMRNARSRNLLMMVAGAGASILAAGYGSQSPVPDVDNSAIQQAQQGNTSLRMVQPQQGAANGGYIINVATSTNQDPQSAVAALNSMPTMLNAGNNITVTTRTTSKYEDMNANDIANYLDNIF